MSLSSGLMGSDEKLGVNLIENPLHVMSCFSLIACKSLSLLGIDSLITTILLWISFSLSYLEFTNLGCVVSFLSPNLWSFWPLWLQTFILPLFFSPSGNTIMCMMVSQRLLIIFLHFFSLLFWLYNSDCLIFRFSNDLFWQLNLLLNSSSEFSFQLLYFSASESLLSSVL